MDRVDPETPAIEIREERVFTDDLDRIDSLVSSLWLEMVGHLFYVLFERTAVSDIHQLHPFADTEYGFSPLEYLLHRWEEKSVILCYHTSRSSRLSAIEAWIDIWSTREYIGITYIEVDTEMTRECRDDDRDPSWLFDGTDIVEGEIIENPSCVFSTLCEDTYFPMHKKKTEVCTPVFVGVFEIFANNFRENSQEVHRLRESLRGSILRL